MLPWVDGVASILSDAYFQNGAGSFLEPEASCARSLTSLAAAGYQYVVGLEIELYIMRLIDPMLKPEQCGWPPEPPQVEGLAHGFQYLTESPAGRDSRPP